MAALKASLTRGAQRLSFYVLLVLAAGYFFFTETTYHGATTTVCDLCNARCCSEVKPQPPENRVSEPIHYDMEGYIRPSTLPGTPATGFTTIDGLYMRNGTYYIITDDPSSFPSKKEIIAYIYAKDGVEKDLNGTPDRGTDPTDMELQFLTPEQAQSQIGDRVMKVPGLSIILDDDKVFMKHYYHWWGEIILGFKRVYSSLEREMSVLLPPPARFIIPYVYGPRWRDPAGVDALLMRAAFPTTAIETSEYWWDLIELDTTIMFERAMIISRAVSHVHPTTAAMGKMLGSTLDLNLHEHFWEPLRQATVRNVLGHLPELDMNGIVVSPPPTKKGRVMDVPIVTYVSRQRAGTRRLNDDDHEQLVLSLEKLVDDGVCRLFVVRMEDMLLKDQIALASRSTILIGVHGNGLTHQLWMQPTPRSSVFEIMYPGTYVFDYEMLARNLDHKHYAVWNDTFITYPKGTYHEKVEWGEESDFHGTNSPVHGEAVASKIRDILTS